jgi:hypothetical protein
MASGYRFDPAHSVWAGFSGETAWKHCAALVEFGPRPSGSPALERSRGYLESQLKAAGWTVSITTRPITN